MVELKRNAIPSSAFGLTPVPDLGLTCGTAFIISRAARVQMPPKCPECENTKVAEIVCEFGLGAGRGLG